jgi:hypothetical protein
MDPTSLTKVLEAMFEAASNLCTSAKVDTNTQNDEHFRKLSEHAKQLFETEPTEEQRPLLKAFLAATQEYVKDIGKKDKAKCKKVLETFTKLAESYDTSKATKSELVFVRDMFDSQISKHATIQVGSASTILDVKKQLEKNRNYPVNKQVMYLDKRELDDKEPVMLLDITNHVMTLQNIDDEFIPEAEVCQKVRVPECQSDQNWNVMLQQIGSLDTTATFTKNYEACTADIAVKQRLYRTLPACQIINK